MKPFVPFVRLIFPRRASDAITARFAAAAQNARAMRHMAILNGRTRGVLTLCNRRKHMKLNGNQLKIFALITMTLDHIGVYLFPEMTWLRIIGRLSYPLFAYKIAEGCTYTKNRKKYLAMLAGVALLCQVVYFFAMKSLYQCIMVTFSLSVSLVYVLDYAKKRKGTMGFLIAAVACMAVYGVTEILPELLSETDFYVDYGFWGVMVPVFVYFAKGRKQKLLAFLAGLVLLAMSSGVLQWYSLISVLIVACYDGTRGKKNLKYLFYIYYPAHLVILYLIGLWI